MILSREHQFSAQLVLGSAMVVLLARRVLTFLLHFLDAICIPQCVEGVLDAGIGGGDVCYHGGLASASGGVLQNLGQFATTEGQMSLLEVQGADTLF